MNTPIPVVCRRDAGAALSLTQIEACFAAESTDNEQPRRRPRSGRTWRRIDAGGQLVGLALTDGEPSTDVEHRLKMAMENCRGTDRHNTVRDDVLALLIMGNAGEPGVRHAVGMLKSEFTKEVGPDRSGGEIEAAAEFDRFVHSERVAQFLKGKAGVAPEAEARFWSSTPVLDHIWRFSRARGTAPYPVLGAILRRAVGCVDPHVVLPPIVGGEASLNLFTATVGRSGAGKDAANSAGHEAVTFIVEMGDSGRIPLVEAQYLHAGTGEGLVRSLMPDEDSASSRRGHLQVADVATLEALAGRQGQTLHATLLSGWMGQPLGFRNNARHTSTAVGAHSYRLCLSVGVQPENAHFFLSREKDGLPQRFLWLPAIDPSAPRERPAEVGPLHVALPSFPVDPEPKFIFEVPSGVRELVMEHRHKVLVGDASVDPLDGHIILTQLKVAAALSILHGQLAITEEMWSLAEHLIDVSAQVRADLRAAAKASRERANRVRAHDMVDRESAKEELMASLHDARAKRAIVSRLKKVGPQDRRALMQTCDSTIRSAFQGALDDLVAQGAVLLADGGMYRLSDE